MKAAEAAARKCVLMKTARPMLTAVFMGMFLAAGVFAAAPSGAADLEAGREKAIKCKQCHGLDGIGKASEIPNIAGQKEAYLIAQLQAFRNAQRQNSMMNFVAKNLSDEDIENLAAYYSSITFAVIMPE